MRWSCQREHLGLTSRNSAVRMSGGCKEMERSSELFIYVSQEWHLPRGELPFPTRPVACKDWYGALNWNLLWPCCSMRTNKISVICNHFGGTFLLITKLEKSSHLEIMSRTRNDHSFVRNYAPFYLSNSTSSSFLCCWSGTASYHQRLLASILELLL